MDDDTRIPFEFKGDGKTYFRIWIVNIFLSVITLGIYSAWAKVRSQRYFYSHLYLDNTNFEYLASPTAILFGRIVAVTLLGSYALISRYLPGYTVWFLLLLIPIVPYVLLKSLQFRARNTAFRNIRFRFHGTYPSALLAIGICPALIPLPFVAHSLWAQHAPLSHYTLYYFAFCTSAFFLGIAIKNYLNFIVSNTSYGVTRFTFTSKIGEYYGMIAMILIGVGTLALLVIFSVLVVTMTMSTLDYSFRPDVNRLIGALIGVVIYLWAKAMFTSHTTNLLYNSIVIPEWYTFTSKVTSWGLFKVNLINTVLIILTLGMYIPFAKIRLIKYRVSALSLNSMRPLDEFMFDSSHRVSATGQEVGEMFGLELGL